MLRKLLPRNQRAKFVPLCKFFGQVIGLWIVDERVLGLGGVLEYQESLFEKIGSPDMCC
mgnify:CR=1 FL=1